MGDRSHRSSHGTDPNDRCRKRSNAVHVEELVRYPGITFRLTDDPAIDGGVVCRCRTRGRTGPCRICERALRLRRAPNCVEGPAERGRERIARRREHPPAVALNRRAEGRLVHQQRRRHCVLVGRPQPRRALHIGEQERHRPRRRAVVVPSPCSVIEPSWQALLRCGPTRALSVSSGTVRQRAKNSITA